METAVSVFAIRDNATADEIAAAFDGICKRTKMPAAGTTMILPQFMPQAQLTRIAVVGSFSGTPARPSTGGRRRSRVAG